MARGEQGGRRAAAGEAGAADFPERERVTGGGASAALRARALLLVALILSTLPFASIVANFFNAEDFVDLYRIANDSLPRFLLTPRGGHVYLIRNAIFFLSYRAFGTQAQYYFLAVLLTHALNVALLFRVIRLLTRSPALACFGATLWGSAAVNEGSLGWYAVYGHVLAGTGLLLVLDGIARR